MTCGAGEVSMAGPVLLGDVPYADTQPLDSQLIGLEMLPQGGAELPEY